MTTSRMTALQWMDIPHIDNIDNLSNEDYECLEEIRGALVRHNRLNKFGIALLHHHFHLDETEILVESVDPQSRTLCTRAVPRSQVDMVNAIETLWKFGENVGEIRAMTECPGGPPGSPTHDTDTRPRPLPPSPRPTPSPGSQPPTDPTTPTPRPTPSPNPSPTPSPNP
jgi:hypothetical protein